MKLYVETKLMTLEDGEHELILRVSEEEFLCYDKIIESDILSRDKEGKYTVREQKSWWSFPLYEIKDEKIIDFDYIKYDYFLNTDRRNRLSFKIKELYNPASEAKILRKTLKKILDHLGITDEGFDKYNTKVEKIIKNNPKI